MTKRRLLILSGLLLSAFFLWYSLRGTNFAEIGEAMTRARLAYVAPLLGAYGLYYWLKAVRWRYLLAPMVKTTARRIFSPMMIGFMGNNILPAHLGEFVRMYLGARDLGLRNTQVLATIVLERLFDFLSVVLFLAIVLLLGKDVPQVLVTSGYVIAALGLAAILVAALYVARTAFFLRFTRRLTFFLPQGVRRGLLHQLELGALGLHALKRPRLLVLVILTSLLQWAFMGLADYLAILSLGVHLSLAAAFLVLAATTFAVTLPAAPGFLGSVQAGFKVALAPFGVSEADAFAASAVFHVPTYLAVTLLGLYLLRRAGMRLREVEAEAEAAAAEEEGEGAAAAAEVTRPS